MFPSLKKPTNKAENIQSDTTIPMKINTNKEFL